MKNITEDIYKALTGLAVVQKEKLDELYEKHKESADDFVEALVASDAISDQNLGQTIAELLHTPFVTLTTTQVDHDVLTVIPEIVAKKQLVVAFKKDAVGLHCALHDPTDLEIIEFIKKKVGQTVVPYFATKRDILDALALYSKDVEKAFDEIIKENVEGLKKASKSDDADPPIIRIVDTIIQYAYQNKASDIHLEPYEEFSLVRFRVDGVLRDVVKLPLTLHPQLVTRIKVLSSLRTDEHMAAQDGKLQIKLEHESLDIRVSVIPTTGGEKAVMRLLSERSRQFSLSSLGISENDMEKMEEAYKKPYGMILATGPTGSGKTTTMYAILKLLNKRNINIMTIEDPVEYDIEGINQIQVNPKANLTFASGLKSIVRQDPDIILVGEIRDQETAGIAINSSLTGHLVLSTLHTNDAATAIPRLLDMNVEPFLVASTVNVIIAQRLVRKICSKCRVSQEVKQAFSEPPKKKNKSIIPEHHDLVAAALFSTLPRELFKKYFGSGTTARLYRGKGCPVCHGTGYADRIGIFEVLYVDEEIRSAIVARKDAGIIRSTAIKNGMSSMLENGLQKVSEGITTLEEVLRVTKEG